jgi:hypothetical protein
VNSRTKGCAAREREATRDRQYKKQSEGAAPHGRRQTRRRKWRRVVVSGEAVGKANGGPMLRLERTPAWIGAQQVKGERASDSARGIYGARNRRMGRRHVQTCDGRPLTAQPPEQPSCRHQRRHCLRNWTHSDAMIQLKVRMSGSSRLRDNSHSCTAI